MIFKNKIKNNVVIYSIIIKNYLLTIPIKLLVLRTDSHFVRTSIQSNPRTLNDNDFHTIFITHTSIDDFDISKKLNNFSSKTYKTFHYHQ